MASQLYQPEWRDRSSIARKPMEEIAAFIKWTITYYKEKEWKDYDLWEGFLDDYCSFTLETFRNCDINTIKNIREHLRRNGVYVRKSRSMEVAKILFELLQENEPAKWPADDPTNDPTTPRLPITLIPQPTATVTTPPGTQTPTPVTPQPPTAPTPQKAVPSAQAPPPQAPSAQAPLASPLPPTAELPLPTNITAVSHDLPPTAEPPLPVNVTAASNDLPTAEPPSPTNTIAPPTNAPNTRLTEAKATTYGKDLATLAKIYTEESKYNGEDNNLDCKLMIFNDLYDRVKIPQAAKIKGLPTMLRGIALDFYYRNKATYITLDGIG